MSTIFLRRMHFGFRIMTINAFFIFVLAFTTYSQQLTQEFISLVERANFIFKGTIVKWDASNIEARYQGKSAIVRIDEVIYAVKAYQGSKNREITVFLADDTALQTSAGSLTFYTVGWYFGNGLGVKEIKNPFRLVNNSKLKDVVVRAQRMIVERYLDLQLKRASVVVEGIVVKTNLDSLPNLNMRSEHNPYLKAAQIDIVKFHKGSLNTNKIIVYYASSTDLAWINSPKLKKNQRGIFLLQKDQASAILNKNKYSVLDFRDVQPTSQLSTINKLLKK